ncbi:Protein transport protein Sec24C [Oopsacas minuta]|uniref:Protein transport protein Sec24C n=1 Tax=Oopsacas minuta TaxID=111878 RepID=A0AAV7KG77_9METZ|nr:Protein transport protein Sec24C [Oopsacas minuta]
MSQGPPYNVSTGRQHVAITTPGMQSYASTQNQLYPQNIAPNSQTPTLPLKFSPATNRHSLTPQMEHRANPLANQMSGLAISNYPPSSTNQSPPFPTQTNQMSFNQPPAPQTMRHNQPPQSSQFPNPPHPTVFSQPPSSNLQTSNPNTLPNQSLSNQFTQLPPTSGLVKQPHNPMNLNPVPLPPTQPPASHTIGHNLTPLQSSQFPNHSQPTGFTQPTPSQFTQPPSSHLIPAGPNQFNQFPPTDGLLPPTQLPPPSSTQFPNPPQSSGLTQPPQQFSPYPPQLMGTGSAPMGGDQFGPPITSQPKVTPDSIPSVIEVLGIDKERWVSNEYFTGSRTPPPGTLISCPIRDTGNASPRYIRSSLYTLPTSADMIKESKLVAGLIIQPLANDPDNDKLPLVDHGSAGPIRCKRCKAYMNPFNSFTGGGAAYECIFCGISNEVPNTYFQYCDATGKRMDTADRSELSKGSYEVEVTKEYMRYQKEGDPPAVILVIDISMRSYNIGLEGFLSSHIADLLDRLPKDDTGTCPLEIGLIVYDTQAYYFNLSAPLPSIYVITESADPFLPEPSGSLVSIPQAITSIKSVLDRFPALFSQRKSGGCLGVGIKAGISMLSEMKRVGKLLVFQADIPEIQGPGQIKRKTDNFFKPQSSFYDKISADCQRAGICVDLFLLPTAYTDVFTLGQLCHSTGGQIHYHYNFSASKPSSYSRLLSDLQETCSTQLGFDAVMRVRTSPGISADQYQGAIRLNGSEIQLAGLDANKTIAVVLRYDDKLKESSLVYVQVALLYTNLRGERRLRLHNLAICTSSHFEDVYLSADLDAMVHLLARLNLRGFIEEQLEQVGERLRQQVAHILATYRRHCNPGVNKGQLILPSTLKLLPCYSNCILKLPVTPLTSSSPNTPDMRSYNYYRLQWLCTREFLLLLYPRVYPVDGTLSSLPEPIRSSVTKIEEQKAYIATDGQQLIMWICNNVNNQLIAEVFGVSSVHQVDPSLSTLPKLDNPTSRHVQWAIESLQSWTGKPLPLSLSKQGDPSENLFRSLLVEDGISGRATYVDATCMLHREIKKLLS